MISNSKISNIINSMSENGYAVTVRDISFLLLCRNYDDATVAYKSIFGDCSETELGVYTKSK